jgi:hypothetical protein
VIGPGRPAALAPAGRRHAADARSRFVEPQRCPDVHDRAREARCASACTASQTVEAM